MQQEAAANASHGIRSTSGVNNKGLNFSWDAMVETGLVRRLLITVGLLVFYRLGVHIPIGDVDQVIFKANSNMLASGILGMVDLFAGGALSALSIFALGIGPFITASIMMQLLAEVFPSIKALHREHGEEGRKKYQQYSRYLSLGLALAQSFALAKYVYMAGEAISKASGQSLLTPGIPGWYFMVKTMLILTAGSLFVMWLGELISEFGIGNGGSLLIFAGIAAKMPRLITQTQEAFVGGSIPAWGLIVLVAFFCLVILAIIYLQEGARKLLIIGSRSQYTLAQGMSGHYLPLKINPAGVLPIIFASMTMFVPFQLLNFAGQQNKSISTGIHDLLAGANLTKSLIAFTDSNFAISNFFGTVGAFFDRVFSYYSWEHSVLYLALIIMFSYFYASILLSPRDIAENLQKGGNAIQGVKPGKPTGDYLEALINRLIFIGGTAIAFITIMPIHVERFCQVTTLGGLGSTSLIIMVGVAIDLYNQVTGYLQAHQYSVKSLID